MCIVNIIIVGIGIAIICMLAKGVVVWVDKTRVSPKYRKIELRIIEGCFFLSAACLVVFVVFADYS